MNAGVIFPGILFWLLDSGVASTFLINSSPRHLKVKIQVSSPGCHHDNCSSSTSASHMRWSDYFILAPTTCRLQQHWNYRRSRAPVMFVHCTAARRHRRLLAFNLQRYSEVQALQWLLLPELWQSQYQWVAVIVPVAGCDTKGLPSTWEWGDKPLNRL